MKKFLRKLNDFFGSKAAPFVAFLVLGGAFAVISQHGQNRLNHTENKQAQIIRTQQALVHANCLRLNVQLSINNRNQLADYISETADLRVFKLVKDQLSNQPSKSAKTFEADIAKSVKAKETSIDSKVWTPLIKCAENPTIHYVISQPVHFSQQLPPKSDLAEQPQNNLTSTQ